MYVRVESIPSDTVTPEMSYQDRQLHRSDALLKEDVKKFEQGVDKYTNAPLNQSQFDALVSFTFNVGLGAYRDSTLLRLLNGNDYEGAAGQFGRWVNGANGPLPGLVRRREAEEKLFRQDGWPNEDGEDDQPTVLTTLVAKQDTVKKEITEYRPGTRSEVVRARVLRSRLLERTRADGHIFVTVPGKGQWFIYSDHWKGQGSQKELPRQMVKVLSDFSQRDNYRDASRTCFSSSCAMFWNTRAGTCPGDQGDDVYVQRVFEIGDTTDAYVQVKASAGITKFVQNGS